MDGVSNAEGYQSAEGFVVLKGSHLSPQDDETAFPAIRERRKNILVDSEWVLQEDVLCRSPSFAAMLVVGKRANGLTSWKTKDGKTLKSLETKWTITPESERLPDKVNDCLELNDYSGKKGPKRAPKAKNAATEERSVAAFGV